MRFEEYVPDYILRNYVKIGQEVTILRGSVVQAQVHHEDKVSSSYTYTVEENTKVQITNFLPGYTEVYAKNGKFPVHNHQVVWKTQTNLTAYHSTDINNVKEVVDAPASA